MDKPEKTCPLSKRIRSLQHQCLMTQDDESLLTCHFLNQQRKFCLTLVGIEPSGSTSVLSTATSTAQYKKKTEKGKRIRRYCDREVEKVPDTVGGMTNELTNLFLNNSPISQINGRPVIKTMPALLGFEKDIFNFRSG